MKNTMISIVSAVFVFLAIVMIAAAAEMMDQEASIMVCVKLMIGSMLALTAGAGIAEWRRLC